MNNQKFYNFMLKNQNTLILISLTMISIYAWVKYTAHLDLNIAYRGFSAFDWLVIRDNPLIKEIGYPTGLSTYYDSFFMHIYIIANDYFGIDAYKMTKIVMAFELLLRAISSYILLKVLFHNLSKTKINFIFIIVYLYFIASFALYPDISNFGAGPIIFGLYYIFADAARLIAIALILKKGYIFASILLIISFLTHPVYGLIGGVFLFCMIIANIHEIDKKEYKHIFISILLFLISITIWYVFSYKDIGIEQMASNDWFSWSLFGNFHWYPIEYGLFTVAHQYRLIGFLMIIVLYLYSLLNKKNINTMDKQIFYGWTGMLFLTVIGLLLSWYKIDPLFIKLSLTRASRLLIEISILYIVYKLIIDILDDKVGLYKKTLSTVLLFTPFLIKSPFPMIFVFLIIFFDVFFKSYNNLFHYHIKRLLQFFVFLIILFLVYVTVNDYINNNLMDVYIANETVYQIFFVIVLFYILSKIFTAKQTLTMVFIIPSILYLSIFWLYNKKYSSNYLDRAKHYKSVQHWADKNTSKDSLFIVDPAISYGWRAYSKRASFGGFREWTHVAWLYKSDNKAFQEGMERLKEFNINVNSEKYAIQPLLKHHSLLIGDIQRKYYSFNKNWFNHIANRYGVEYIVMEKQLMKTKLNYKIVYENDRFIVFQII